MKKIVFTGGGTAGHVTPNIALIKHLLQDYEIHYIGSKNGMEKELISSLKIPYHEIDCIKFVRSFTLKNLAIPFVLSKGISQAKKLLNSINPSLVFSKGGFVGLPLGLACKKIPLVIHESDYSLGLANKLALKNAKMLCCAFDSISHPKATYTGSPIRSEIYYGNKTNAIVELGLSSSNLPYLLVIGGSSGAKALNDFVFENVDALIKKFNIVHVVGKNETRAPLIKGYTSIPYSNKIYDLFALADVVLSRAGANTLCELVALGKKTVCVPLEKGSRGDQLLNATYYQNKGALTLLRQSNLNLTTFFEKVNYLYANEKEIYHNCKSLQVDGTQKLLDIIKTNAI